MELYRYELARAGLAGCPSSHLVAVPHRASLGQCLLLPPALIPAVGGDLPRVVFATHPTNGPPERQDSLLLSSLIAQCDYIGSELRHPS